MIFYIVVGILILIIISEVIFDYRTMTQCLDCGKIFKYPKAKREIFTDYKFCDYHTDPPDVYEKVTGICPYCESTNLVIIKKK